MTHPVRNRSRLLVGCGSAALALALALAPQQARAQAINATGNVVSGSASINDTTPGQTTIDVGSPTVVIDWTPSEDVNGDALTFLPAGTTALFQEIQQPNYAVLNRILPSTNGNIVVIDGNVLSRVTDPVSGAQVAGGFVAFYSPTGFLIGDNAAFDVGSLMLTTLEPSVIGFENFATFGGNMTLQGATGSTARIQINPGAQISALAENSFFAVVAADVQMLGTAQVNGSHAYIAGEVVNLSFSNGLFNISVPVGTAASGTVMELDGNIGGPSSLGLGDNHMIYGVAAAQADPISMIFRGNLGFDPAQSAGVINGEIILSANHDVFGRFVDGGSISDGVNAVFGASSATSDVRADIFVEDFTASSSLLAISTHRTQVSAVNAASSVAGNLLMVGRENAELTSSNGQSFVITGDVLVSAQDYGVLSSSLQSLDLINATGGVAFIDAFGGGTMDIGGSARVLADAFAGADDLNLIAGTAQGGSALIGSTGGTLNITGSAEVSARGSGAPLSEVFTGATARGGLAQFFATEGGNVTLGGSLLVDARAFGSQGSLFSPSSVSDAFGGTAGLNIFNGGGSITIGGDVTLDAGAIGGSANATGAGSLGDAGSAVVDILGAGNIAITGGLAINAEGTGGLNAGGIGGIGLGGRAAAVTDGNGTISIGTGFGALARGTGGDGESGGDGLGGIAVANAVVGTITIGGSALAIAEGRGGGASFGFGGNGGIGRGGNAAFQANGTLTDSALVSITGDATVIADGEGGFGGQTDGSLIAAGRGGDGYGGQFTVPNQADANFGSGAYLLAGGDNGTLDIGGVGFAAANGRAGTGGSGGSILPGGRGGDAFGGLAQIGLALLGQDGSLGQGSAIFTEVLAEANAFGGNGGFSFGDFPTGEGGNATGGDALLTIRAGTVTADSIALDAGGFGGDGRIGGLGTGGVAAAFGGLGGSFTTDFFAASANGFGGFSGFDDLNPGVSGDGQGGLAEFDFTDITVQVNGDVNVIAEGFGGGTGEFTAGNGTGGTARLGVLGTLAGSGTITGNTVVSSNGFGGFVNNGLGQAGDGSGGTTTILAGAGGTVSLQTVQAMANGFGGQGEVLGYEGGDGFGGNADISATGSGSQITIARNVTTLFADDLNFGAILSANGVGSNGTGGGAGVGGNGTGGTALVSAALGGSIALPADPLNDPDSVGFNRLLARGFGGNTFVNGGVGGDSFGGNAIIDVEGGLLTMGETLLSSFTQGGTAENGALDVTGGNAFGGSRTVSIRDGGTATLHLVGGGAGAQGGNGSGVGNGGDAIIGQNLFEVDNATANIIGNLPIFDQSQGGNGQQGGNVFNVNPLTGVAGSLDIVLDFATINFIPDALGVSGIGVDFFTRGGNGVVRGGNAQGPNVNLTINQTDLSGSRLVVSPFIQGGDASAIDGIGGDAFGSLVTIAISSSQLTLPGQTLFAADALGGLGGANGAGGNATSGTVNVTLTGSTINLAADPQGAPGSLRVRAQATGGLGGIAGNATAGGAALNIIDSAIAGAGVYVEASAFANGALPGQPGGTALGGAARIGMSGVSGITADLVEVNANATSSQGGAATAGSAFLEAFSGTATITAPTVNLFADATSTADDTAGSAGATEGGQAQVSVTGGSLAITGDLFANARGIGAVSANLLSGAVSRGGEARLIAQNGGSVALGGDVGLDASATGAEGSLVNGSTQSDAFGGNAAILVAAGGGTITIAGDARLNADAVGGAANFSGSGSLADAGEALVNIADGGLIDIAGSLRLDAQARGGDNAGGIGGEARGGRASATTFNGGTIRMSAFEADTLAEGGDGLAGGDAFGGIAGVNAIIGEIEIIGQAFAGTEGVGGSATFGFGGNGGLGRGGNSYFQADGTLTVPARVIIGGDATAVSQGVGGNGGASDGNAVAAGRGGDGFGGQFSVPNQADPAFGSGAFILAGGDNGTITVGGDAVAVSIGLGGTGGAGSAGLAGGRGGDAFGGLAQVGLALLGQNGSVGQGLASFGNVLVQADAFGGAGGASPLPGVAGDGGNAIGGGALVTVRAGDITANRIELAAGGFGGAGALGGNGSGGDAAVLGSLGGTLTAIELNILAQGLGGAGLGTAGGNALGGVAAIEGDGITVTVNGSAFVNASASAGGSSNGAGGDATGGEAYIATISATPGTITVTGHVQVQANGLGGGTASNFPAGNGTGGLAFVEALGGSTVTLGSAQVGAVGRGGTATLHEGGDGTGGTVRISAQGANSRVTIQRNVPNDFVPTPLIAGAILNANGIGDAARGGNGIGGTGIGGTVELVAATGGTIALPTDLTNDPNSTNPNLLFFARGFGGGSSVEGGAGGDAFGGNATILADGGTIVMGPASLSSFAQAGNALSAALNIDGGNVIGGNRAIRAINGGTLTMQTILSGPGGTGGSGSGSGAGGDVLTGTNLFEVIDSTVNLIGNFSFLNQSSGGNGEVGGNVTGGTLIFNAENATINLLPDANGQASLSFGGAVQGGNGVSAGGTATAATTSVTIVNSAISGGRFLVNPLAIGGNASAVDGIGGNATGALVNIGITNSQLDLAGETLFAADAIGGAGGTGGIGGSADSGTVEAVLAGSTVAIATDGSGNPGILRVRSQADAGDGGTMGSATGGRATLALDGTTLGAAQISIEARGFANANSAGQTGGTAVGGNALLAIAGDTQVTTDLIELVSNAQSSSGGITFAGLSALEVAGGSTATVTAGAINLLADAFGADQASQANLSGQFAIDIAGGNVNAGTLLASATGDQENIDLGTSRLVADGGNLNVAGALTARTIGDLLIRTGGGGIIGSPATTGTLTEIGIDATGTIEVVGDGSTGGLGGRTIDMVAGRSILLGGNLATSNGTITLTANQGNAPVLGQPPVSVFTMAQGTRIDAGTGAVIINLLDGEGDPQRANGAITLASISGGLIDVRNFGSSPGSDITVLADGVLTASGTGRAIDLASLNGEVINLAGDAGLILTGGGHYGIFAESPSGSQIGSFANYARRYNVPTGEAYDDIDLGGNFAAFRFAPVLTVTVDDATRFYGSANPQFTASFAGFLAGDGLADILGTPEFLTLANGTSGVGVFAVNAALGTLLSEQGYQFTFAPGQLTITARPIIVTANDLSRIYGNANPALTFTVGGEGLVNGDQLTGALATTAGLATGVGAVPITQGTLAANPNYLLTFVDGQLAITPRPLTVIANSFSRLLGLPDPEFTFVISGDGLVNGDQLTGALVRDPGESFGTYAIRQGTLTAGDNYAIDFVNGQLTIDPPPAPPVLTNPTLIDEPIQTGDDPPVPGDEEEERFGMDFPDQPEAPLITEDPLLDDPVTSGGDASLYSGGGSATPGSEDK